MSKKLASTVFNLAPGTTLGSKYRLLELVGQGGMGTVWKAVHLLSEQCLCLKVLSDGAPDTSALQRFIKESKALARLEHRNIVKVNAFEILDGVAILVTDFIAGNSIRELLLRDGPFSTKTVLPLFKQLAEGLAYAHSKGVVHRDIKPANIMLTEIGTDPPLIRIVDFGLASIVTNATPGHKLTASNSLLGTPSYMSPEQISTRVVDARSDIYSAGCLMFEMIVGRTAFAGDTVFEVCAQHVNLDRYELYSQIADPVLASVIIKCLCVTPDGRYASADELRQDIDAILAGEPHMVTAKPCRPATNRLSRSRPLFSSLGRLVRLALSVSVVLVALSIALSLYWDNSIAQLRVAYCARGDSVLAPRRGELMVFATICSVIDQRFVYGLPVSDSSKRQIISDVYLTLFLDELVESGNTGRLARTLASANGLAGQKALKGYQILPELCAFASEHGRSKKVNFDVLRTLHARSLATQFFDLYQAVVSDFVRQEMELAASPTKVVTTISQHIDYPAEATLFEDMAQSKSSQKPVIRRFLLARAAELHLNHGRKDAFDADVKLLQTMVQPEDLKDMAQWSRDSVFTEFVVHKALCYWYFMHGQQDMALAQMEPFEKRFSADRNLNDLLLYHSTMATCCQTLGLKSLTSRYLRASWMDSQTLSEPRSERLMAISMQYGRWLITQNRLKEASAVLKVGLASGTATPAIEQLVSNESDKALSCMRIRSHLVTIDLVNSAIANDDSTFSASMKELIHLLLKDHTAIVPQHQLVLDLLIRNKRPEYVVCWTKLVRESCADQMPLWERVTNYSIVALLPDHDQSGRLKAAKDVIALRSRDTGILAKAFELVLGQALLNSNSDEFVRYARLWPEMIPPDSPGGVQIPTLQAFQGQFSFLQGRIGEAMFSFSQAEQGARKNLQSLDPAVVRAGLAQLHTVKWAFAAMSGMGNDRAQTIMHLKTAVDAAKHLENNDLIKFDQERLDALNDYSIPIWKALEKS